MGAILRVLAFKLNVLRQKFVIIFANSAGVKLGVLASQISV